MLLRKGATVILGGREAQKKVKKTSSGNVEYSKETLRLSEGIMVSYNLATQSVKVVYSAFLNVEAEYPFCYEPLNVGVNGDSSYIPPELLDPSHTGYITNLGEDNMCTLNRTGERCRLILDAEFEATGIYFLDTSKGKTQFRSKKWTRRSLLNHLDGLKGSVLEGRAVVDGIMLPSGKFVEELDLNLASGKNPVRDAVVFLLFKNGTHIGYPIMLIE